MDWGWLVALILILPFVVIIPVLSFAGLIWGLFIVIRDNVRERAATKRASETGAKGALVINKTF